jgi:hypothetical protein
VVRTCHCGNGVEPSMGLTSGVVSSFWRSPEWSS